MEVLSKRLVKLGTGLVLYAIGIALTITAQIGYSPWDVFHSGLSEITGLTIGVASISASCVVVSIAFFMGEKLGLGTISNMTLIGLMLDYILAVNIIPRPENIVLKLLMLLLGLTVIAVATFLYLSSGFGGGPRDSLMVALSKRTKLSVGICRSGVELLALFAGWLLGGFAGIGTVISALWSGFCIQFVFKKFKFNAAAIEHETLNKTYELWIKPHIHKEQV